MKQGLIIGGGAGNGSIITDTLVDRGYDVTNVGSSIHPRAHNITVDWQDLDIPFVQKNFKFDNKFDFIFFNQKSSSLRQEDFKISCSKTLKNWKLLKDWTHSNWLSCQLPFLILHTIENNLHKETCVGWMLSRYAKYDQKGNTEHADYSSFKYFNYLQMQCFANQNEFRTFGIYPDFALDKSKEMLSNIINEVLSKTEKHKEYYM